MIVSTSRPPRAHPRRLPGDNTGMKVNPTHNQSVHQENEGGKPEGFERNQQYLRGRAILEARSNDHTLPRAVRKKAEAALAADRYSSPVTWTELLRSSPRAPILGGRNDSSVRAERELNGYPVEADDE